MIHTKGCNYKVVLRCQISAGKLHSTTDKIENTVYIWFGKNRLPIYKVNIDYSCAIQKTTFVCTVIKLL